jgi:hypothetical protein
MVIDQGIMLKKLLKTPVEMLAKMQVEKRPKIKTKPEWKIILGSTNDKGRVVTHH